MAVLAGIYLKQEVGIYSKREVAAGASASTVEEHGKEDHHEEQVCWNAAAGPHSELLHHDHGHRVDLWVDLQEDRGRGVPIVAVARPADVGVSHRW